MNPPGILMRVIKPAWEAGGLSCGVGLLQPGLQAGMQVEFRQDLGREAGSTEPVPPDGSVATGPRRSQMGNLLWKRKKQQVCVCVFFSFWNSSWAEGRQVGKQQCHKHQHAPAGQGLPLSGAATSWTSPQTTDRQLCSPPVSKHSSKGEKAGDREAQAVEQRCNNIPARASL